MLIFTFFSHVHNFKDCKITKTFLTEYHTCIGINFHPAFFIWMDHGMGIVSLQSRKYDSFQFRMARFKLMSKVKFSPSCLYHLIFPFFVPQGNLDLNSDFRLIENSDSSVKFESVTCPGGFLGIPNRPCSPITNISIYLVVRHVSDSQKISVSL